jgi:acyl-CoA synthetase (AMP-forming)/AMP-acid ligase II
VTGIPDALRGQRVVASICAAPAAASGAPADNSSAGLTAAGQHHGGPDNVALLQALRRAAAQLPAPQRPSRYFELSMLPLTGSGKISRPLLARWINEGDPRARRLH